MLIIKNKILLVRCIYSISDRTSKGHGKKTFLYYDRAAVPPLPQCVGLLLIFKNEFHTNLNRKNGIFINLILCIAVNP